MNKTLKYGGVALILLGVVLILWLAPKNPKPADKISEQLARPFISLEGFSCDIPKDSRSSLYSVTIEVLLPGWSKQVIVDNLGSFGGTVTSEVDLQDSTGRIANSLDLEILFPNDQLKRFSSWLHDNTSKIASSTPWMTFGVPVPAQLKDENFLLMDYEELRSECDRNLDALKSLQQEEEFYLSRLEADPANTEVTFDNLLRVRREATEHRNTLSDFFERLNKFKARILIRQFLG